MVTLRDNSSSVTLVVNYWCTVLSALTLCKQDSQMKENQLFLTLQLTDQDGIDLWFRLFSAASRLFKAQCRGNSITDRKRRFFGRLQSNCESTILASVLHSALSAQRQLFTGRASTHFGLQPYLQSQAHTEPGERREEGSCLQRSIMFPKCLFTITDRLSLPLLTIMFFSD